MHRLRLRDRVLRPLLLHGAEDERVLPLLVFANLGIEGARMSATKIMESSTSARCKLHSSVHEHRCEHCNRPASDRFNCKRDLEEQEYLPLRPEIFHAQFAARSRQVPTRARRAHGTDSATLGRRTRPDCILRPSRLLKGDARSEEPTMTFARVGVVDHRSAGASHPRGHASATWKNANFRKYFETSVAGFSLAVMTTG